jgi:maltose/maltodextrin transport system substrate-binding protein
MKCLHSTPERRAVSRRGALLAATSLLLADRFAVAGSAPRKQGPLVIWFTVEGAKALRRVGEAFTAATGVPVVVETPDNGPAKFQQAASAGKVPDIYMYTHDRIGEWTAGGLLHAVAPSRQLLADVDPLAWKGFTYWGRVWGYPIAIEAVTLIYSKALVKTPPATFDEVFALDAQLAAQGKRSILWDYTNPYFSWPLLAANGAYAFAQRTDGRYDPRDTSAQKRPSIIAACWLQATLW